MRTPIRFLVTALLGALFALVSFAAQPQLLKPPKKAVHGCKSRCSVQYDFCMKHATTKNARKGCSATRKNCKGQCGG
jgi:hypothetical protein